MLNLKWRFKGIFKFPIFQIKPFFSSFWFRFFFFFYLNSPSVEKKFVLPSISKPYKNGPFFALGLRGLLPPSTHLNEKTSSEAARPCQPILKMLRFCSYQAYCSTISRNIGWTTSPSPLWQMESNLGPM